jgi:[ribosomal protein S18]-alanine N-acetyltransferase
VSWHITPLPLAALPLPALPLAARSLAAMHAACFPDDPWDAPALERVLALSGVFGYLAWQDDAALGFVVARDLGEEAEILSIGTLPPARRRGIGRALLGCVAAQSRQRGLGSVVLEVAADNEAARQLYAVHGFLQVGRRPHYYRRAEGSADALILRLGIRPDTTPDTTAEALPW